MDSKLNLKVKLIVFLLLSVFLMISISAVAATDNDTPQWSKQAADNQNTGQSPYLGPQKNTTKWNKSFSENDSQASTPVVGHDGTVYVGTNNIRDGIATLHAFNSDGSKKWTYNLQDETPEIDAAAIGPDGTIYLAISFRDAEYWHSKLYALQDSGTSATVKWSHVFTGSDARIGSSPVVGSDGTIYVGVNFVDSTSYGKLYALNPDGTLKWNYEVNKDLENRIVGSPAISTDGTIYFNGNYWEDVQSAFLCALKDDGAHATKKWETVISEGNFDTARGSPVVGPDGTIYVTENAWIDNLDLIATGNLFAFKDNGDSVSQKWKYRVPIIAGQSSITSGVAVAKEGTIYFGVLYPDNICYLFAVNDMITNAIKKWDFQTEYLVDFPPIIGSDGTIYFGDHGRIPDTFHALDPSSGKSKWSYHGTILSAAAMAQNGDLYFVTGAGLLKTNSKSNSISLIAIKGPASSLYVKTSVDNNNPTVGDVINVLFKVGNNGPNTAYNTILTYVVPKGFKFIKAWADVGTISYDPITRIVTWNLGNVPVGDPSGHVRMLAEKIGTFSIVPSISTSSNDSSISQNIGTTIVNVLAATNNDTNSTDDTVAMQPTGMPFAMLFAAILMVLGGSILPLRKN